jgi:plastocyanin
LRYITRMRLALLAVVAVASVAVAGSAFAARTATAPQKVTVTATEYHFAMAKKTFKVGKVVFTLQNKGTEVHDFKVNGKTPKSRFLAPGQKQTFTINFTKAGRYQFLCTIGEHAIKGMQGVLIIKK